MDSGPGEMGHGADVTAAVRVVRCVGVDLAQEQSEDEVLGPILRAKLEGSGRPEWTENSKQGDLNWEW